MSDITDLRIKHLEEIAELQTYCTHKNITGWIDEEWAPGHSYGKVRVCKNCDKIIDRNN